MVKRRTVKKSLLDRIFDLVDYFFPIKKSNLKTKAKNEIEEIRENSKDDNKQVPEAISDTTSTNNSEETNLQTVYTTHYLYEGEIKTGKQLLISLDRIHYTESGQLAFINTLQKSGYLIDPSKPKSDATLCNKETILTKEPVKKGGYSPELFDFYVTQFIHEGIQKSGKDILRLADMLSRTNNEQINFLENLIKENKIIDLSLNKSRKREAKTLPHWEERAKIDRLYKEEFIYCGQKMNGHSVLKNASRLDKKAEIQFSYIASQLNAGKLQPLNRYVINTILPKDMLKNIIIPVHQKSSVQKNTHIPKKITQPKLIVTDKSSIIIQNKNSTNQITLHKEDLSQSQQEQSIGKMFGGGAGLITGVVLGGPIAIAGELFNSEMLQDIGEKVIKATTQTGKILGEAANGGINSVIGAISDDQQAIDRGKKQLSSAGRTFGNSVIQTVENVIDNTGNIVDGIRYGDTDQLKSGAKSLVKTVAVGALAVGVTEAVIDSSTDNTHSSNGATVDPHFHTDGVDNSTVLASSSDEHFVKPHEVSAHLRGDTYIEAYIRDGDGDTSVDRTVEEGGGYMRNNPNS